MGINGLTHFMINYVTLSSPILLTCRIPVFSMYLQAEWNTVWILIRWHLKLIWIYSDFKNGSIRVQQDMVYVSSVWLCIIVIFSQKKVQADQLVTQATIKEALDILRGAVTIVYPMGLPPHDNIRLEFENNEDLSGTQVRHLLIACWVIFHAFSKFTFSPKKIQDHYQSVKWFGSRSGQTFCWSWSGSKLFAKVIRRWLFDLILYVPSTIFQL